MDNVCVNKEKYKNGYVISFYFENNRINDNPKYLNYLENREDLSVIEYDEIKYNILSCYHFFEEDTTSVELAKYMKKVIDIVYKLPGKDPQILFNLRTLKRVT